MQNTLTYVTSTVRHHTKVTPCEERLLGERLAWQRPLQRAKSVQDSGLVTRPLAGRHGGLV